jgi:CRP-like cAMP-binding protein
MAGQRRHTPLAKVAIDAASCSIHERQRVLGRVPFFQHLDEAALVEVNRAFRAEDHPADGTICEEGEPARGLHVVAMGKVKLVRHTLSGQDVLLDILAPGAFFGSLAAQQGAPYPESAQALTPVCILSIVPPRFRALLLAHPQAALAVADLLAERLRAANESIRQLSAHPVEQRLASVLLKLARTLGEPDARGVLIQVPLSRKDLADMTGTSTETASRILSQFQKQGLVRSGRRWVAVHDPAALERLAQAI